MLRVVPWVHLLNESNGARERGLVGGTKPAVPETTYGSYLADHVVALHALDEEAKVVDELERRVVTLAFPGVVEDGVEQWNRDDAWRRVHGADHFLVGAVPVRARILGDQIVHALLRRTGHHAGLGRNDVAVAHDGRVAVCDVVPVVRTTRVVERHVP